MRYLAFAADYDGTLARNGAVAEATISALETLRVSHRKLLLVTGREMDDIIRVFPQLDLFDVVVAENGAVIYRPRDGSERYLADRPGEQFLNALKKRNVSPLGVGRVIIGSWETQSEKIRDAIRECGLNLHLILNKGSLMVLPAGVDKASGLLAALAELGISPKNLVAVGDGENDIPMLKSAACGAAVAGALDVVKASADIVLTRDNGEGVIELIASLKLADN